MFDDFGTEDDVERLEVWSNQNGFGRAGLKPEMGKHASGMLDHPRDRLDPFACAVSSGKIRQPSAAASHIKNPQGSIGILLLVSRKIHSRNEAIFDERAASSESGSGVDQAGLLTNRST